MNNQEQENLLHLYDSERAKLDGMVIVLNDMKMGLADLQLQITALEAQKHELAVMIGKKGQEIIEQIKEIALAKGIDMSKGNWNLDLHGFKLTERKEN